MDENVPTTKSRLQRLLKRPRVSSWRSPPPQSYGQRDQRSALPRLSSVGTGTSRLTESTDESSAKKPQKLDITIRGRRDVARFVDLFKRLMTTELRLIADRCPLTSRVVNGFGRASLNQQASNQRQRAGLPWQDRVITNDTDRALPAQSETPETTRRVQDDFLYHQQRIIAACSGMVEFLSSKDSSQALGLASSVQGIQDEFQQFLSACSDIANIQRSDETLQDSGIIMPYNRPHESESDLLALTVIHYDVEQQADFDKMTTREQIDRKTGDRSVLLRRLADYEMRHIEEASRRELLIDQEQPVSPPEGLFQTEHDRIVQAFQTRVGQVTIEIEGLKQKYDMEDIVIVSRHIGSDTTNDSVTSTERPPSQDESRTTADEAGSAQQQPVDLSRMDLDELAAYANVTFPQGLDIEHIKLSTFDDAVPEAASNDIKDDLIKAWLQNANTQEQI